MTALRTPLERFAQLPDFPYAPRYVDVDDAGLRMAYVDEGPRSAAPILCLHGEPTWSFLYRKMIPILVRAGHRVVAPDLIGFGRSDKPAALADYSYARHVGWLAALVRALDLRGATLVGQDWGSLVGLRYAMEDPSRFARITIGNGGLPAGQAKVPGAFRVWRGFARYSPLFPIGRIVAAGCARGLSPEARAAYDAPYPTDAHKAGARAFPRLVPTDAGDPAMPAQRAAWDALGRWDKPFLCVFGKRDPILGRGDRILISHVPGAKDQPHARIDASHFLQEDSGEDWAERIVAWIASGS